MSLNTVVIIIIIIIDNNVSLHIFNTCISTFTSDILHIWIWDVYGTVRLPSIFSDRMKTDMYRLFYQLEKNGKILKYIRKKIKMRNSFEENEN